MAPQLKLYTVLSYILIPIALFFAFLDVLILFSSLANPSALIMVFIVACLVIYTFASFKFLKFGIEREIVQTKKLKDFIKVNAYVSFFLCSLFFVNSISVLISTNAVLLKFIDEFLNQQPNIPKEITNNLVLEILRGVSVFLLITGIIGIVHIRTTLRLVKAYPDLFE
jgi:membrane protease YdiL (CAAX protease family)